MEAAPEAEGASCRLEFAVQMNCQECVDAVQASLQGATGLRVLDIQLDSQSVLVETSMSSEKVKDLLESTGRRAVLKGMGSNAPHSLGAAVAMMSGPSLVQGVVRFLQVSPEKCIIEGTIDGLEPGLHGLHIHEFGDITNSCDSCGDHFNPNRECHGGPQDAHRLAHPGNFDNLAALFQHLGDLGNVLAGNNGRAAFQMEDTQLKVWDIIGRSLVVDSGEDDLGQGGHPLSKVCGNSGERLACGIIARSAGLFENPKQICTCDGVTLWEEREKPVAGPGRRVQGQPASHL
ncbi:copper chaperone for superoxide dismutase isoform X2 [Pelodiscus sinensis]|uniref:copper chaperone for superoxide dismutase isoform X2 n=1 Tax=Pelodiscus sinensis TaxID=13735 RepID=UPI003F6B70E9